MAVSYPTINGVRYDASSYEIRILGQTILGVKSLEYSAQLEPQDVYGLRSGPIGRTRGKASFTGSIELYRAEASDFEILLQRSTAAFLPKPGAGIFEVEFDVNVTIFEITQGLPITDVLRQCRLKSSGRPMPGAGTGEPASVKYDLSVMSISLGNQSQVNTVAAKDGFFYP
jgi:hypothetical protein